MKENRNYKHLKHLAIDEILPFIKDLKTDEDKMVIKVEEQEYCVKVSSQRLRLFKHSDRKCVSCGRVGNVFVLDKQLGHKLVIPLNKIRNDIHLNLYCYTNGQKNEYVLMTQDHIIPRSLGGNNGLNNLQVMCEFCNSKKENKITKRDIKRLTATEEGRKNLIKYYKMNGNGNGK